MVEIDLERGLVAFFDILGYQQMLMNNEVETTAHLIVDVISNIPSDIITSVTRDQGLGGQILETSKFVDEIWNKVIREEVKWLLFSDSILVSLPVDPSREVIDYGFRWLAFIHVCAFLQREMFDRGLPLRGAIAFGEFFIKDTYFAGKPIIESYQASESLEMSGCVLTKTSEEIYRKFKQEMEEKEFENMISAINQLCVPYLVPKKRERLEKQITINWVNLPLADFKNLPDDIREYVYSSFVDYNKDVAPIIYPKINNTETYIRKILRNVKSTPWVANTEKTDAYMQSVMKERKKEV